MDSDAFRGTSHGPIRAIETPHFHQHSRYLCSSHSEEETTIFVQIKTTVQLRGWKVQTSELSVLLAFRKRLVNMDGPCCEGATHHSRMRSISHIRKFLSTPKTARRPGLHFGDTFPYFVFYFRKKQCFVIAGSVTQNP